MSKSEKIFSRMKEQQLIALLSPKNADECFQAYEILDPLNVVLEVALRTEFAEMGIQAIHEKYPDALVLAGTVMTEHQAESAIKAGAAGIVSPDYFPKVVETCVKENILCIPGGIADVGKQLVQKAEEYGCSLEELQELYPFQWNYKMFPVFAGGIANMDLAQAWRGLYKNLTVIYTGGITLDTLREAQRKDPSGIFCASALTKHIAFPEKLEPEVREWQRVIKERSV
jgi:2-keto-3-deoxy-6-phosphogluconate aldolase